MIKFFRHIRQNLLSEGKTGKPAWPVGRPAWPVGRYLKYAIGEIVLVVIGILIALSINNWNESRKQSASEKEFITSLKNDLKQDKAFILLIVDVLEPKIEAYKTLNGNLTNLYQNDRKALDSICQIYFKSQRTFYPISGSYESAVSGNQITAFRNKELIQKVFKLYNSTYDRLNDNGHILDERWAFVTKKYSYERRTGVIREMTPEGLSEFLDDLYHHYVQMIWYQNQLKSTAVEIDEIIVGYNNH